jgi:hypothetical protein
MLGRKRRWALVVLALAATAFVAVGGPAGAKHFINGNTIKPGSIGSTQIAKGSIGSTKLSRSLRRSLTGKTGKTGATGAAGAPGAPGAAGGRGAAGAFNVVDAGGHVVGLSVGFLSGVYPEVLINGGIYVWDNSPTNALIVGSSITLYYKAAGCGGTAYLPFTLYPPQQVWTLETTAAPGTTAYNAVPGAGFESFSYLSRKTSTGCTDTAATAITNALPAQVAGTVPSVQKPLRIVPAG